MTGVWEETRLHPHPTGEAEDAWRGIAQKNVDNALHRAIIQSQEPLNPEAHNTAEQMFEKLTENGDAVTLQKTERQS